ncbi:two-component system histidine kinase PnpS [Paenibacillus protaetiae]|uniref:histidine kinase n=1 Tax=Paenibacillus protaetiae TaxID=2509456 RepID=A0A4P6F2Q8_9BACL|nr:ATP-binding protein [Paenibacillus protaetiae]QAY68429.1 HAMP domain-containing histidine kinase [Paenibacillus protaetiae]
MSSFRNRLTIIMIVIIALSVSAAGLIMVKTFRDSHIEALENSMVREMKLIIASMEWPSSNSREELFDYYTQEAKQLQDKAGARVTFIAGDGTVLGDSVSDPKSMENHSSRKEFIDARSKGTGRAIRNSATLRQNYLYVAVPVNPSDPDSMIVRLSMSLKDVEQGITQLWAALIGWLLLLCVIAALISFRIAKSLTYPLEQITNVAKRITRMDYRARVKVQKQDEIGELGHAINAMAESLQVQMSRIQRNETQLETVLDNMINGIVMIDTSGRFLLMNRRAEEVLGFSAKELVGRHYTEAKQQYELAQMIQECLQTGKLVRDEITFYFPEERLLELNLVPVHPDTSEFAGVLLVLQDVTAVRRLERVRSEFVANVSHELKTPIAAVKGFAETLLSGGVKDEETARSFLQIIFDESDRLNRLISDILELSKVESRRVPLVFSPIEMESFINKTVKVIESQAAKKLIQLNVSLEEGLYVEADEDRLRQILMNLLANGISYTPEGGKVFVRVESLDEDHISIAISDTGIGIPKKDLPRIFERFYRVDKARSRSSGGTGLGLSIVKHLVELHKGTISVASELGEGSTFTIVLPVLQESIF